MIRKNYRLSGIILVLAIAAILIKSQALASDLRVAVGQNKPVLRGNPSQTIDLRGATNISRSNPKITLSLKNTDVQPVLRMFADKAGINIILHPSVKGYVNLDLVNVPLNDAFRMVLQVTDLTYTQDGNTIIVSSSEFARTSGISKQSINTVPINYVDASMIANFLNQNIFSKKTPGLSNWDVVVTNAIRNELLVFGTQNDLAMVKKIVAKFDVPPLNTTFTVRHTTPSEMATLVCRMLKMTEGELDMGSQSIQWDYSTIKNEGNSGTTTGLAANIRPARKSVFAVKRKGIVTGFASSSGSGSSSGGSGGGSSSGGGEGGSGGSSSTIELGKNTVACIIGSGSSGTDGSSGNASGSQSQGGGNAGGFGRPGGGVQGVGSAFSSVSGGVSNGTASLKLNSFGSQKMVVSFFPQRGTINILGGSKTIIDRVAAFIKENDVKQPQAFMDITVLEMNETGQKDFTNTWHFYSKNFDFSSDVEGNTSADVRIGPNSPQSLFYKISGAPQMTWFVNYVINNRKGRVVANPKIILTNGETSKIDLTSEYIDTVDAEIQTTSSEGIRGVERTYNKGSDLGLQFNLVPFISPEGYISLNFKADYSTMKEQVQAALTGSGDKELVATLLNKRNVELKNVRIKDNETLLIGGLVQENDVKSVAKIPILGDIPVVGVLFRSSSTQKEKNELIILLTPRILKDTEDIGADQADTL